VFSPDGRLIALSVSPQQVRLAETGTGRTIANLSTLQPLAATPLAFSLDGTWLIARTEQKTALIWNLRRIRQRLQKMGLDWDQPPFPPEDDSPGSTLPAIRSVRVMGEALEPTARRAAELAAVDAKLRDHPDDADALFDRGWLMLRMAKPAEAITDLDRGLRLRPDDSDALFLLAEAQTQTNKPTAARATLEKYLARASDDIGARTMIGQVALQLGLLPEAADDFSKVLDADPGRDPVRYRRAQIRLRLGKLQEALADLDSLIQHYPQDAGLYELRGQVHERLGHREQAQADMKQAANSPQACAQHINNLAWRMATGPAALRDPQQALVLARKAVAMTPGQAIYLNTLGVAQYRAEQYAEAIVTVEKSLAASKGESDGFDLFFLAMARHKLGQLDRAKAGLDRALRWRREHPNPAGPGWTEELNMFQAEAEELLNAPLPPLPANPFAPE
jgi:tetratricopeptide (TPR) repeat protein